jgi:hypothetical protein
VRVNEEVVGRDAATRRLRRKKANLPTGMTLATWRICGVSASGT